jgi:DNA helicase-2/ATP-dependent DNA helicase PcrA
VAVDYQKILNPAQYRAVSHQGGPLLIVAGAGTGKTRTLTHRVAYLIDQGRHPQSILLLTFTRKAAQEMLTRSAELVGGMAGKVSGGTFHALAHRLLRKNAFLLDFPAAFSVMGQDDSETLLNQIRAKNPRVKTYDRFPQKGAILNVLSQTVNREIPLAEVVNRHFPHFRPFISTLSQLGQEYQAEKRARSLMDFDDLLVYLVKILEENEATRQAIASSYAHVLIDEYQDTNPLQARLTWLLGKDHQQVTVVGDEAQSIYSFRGASFRNIMDFPTLFPGATIIALEDNYRSKAPILAVANKVIAGAEEKYDKKLASIRGDGPLPTLQSLPDLASEAALVASAIRDQAKKGYPLGEMAVLFRNASHSFELELLLQKYEIPFTKYGGRKFLESAHVKGFLSILRAVVNPGDGISLKRALMDIPAIGSKYADQLVAWVGGDPKKLALLDEGPVSERIKYNLKELSRLMAELIRPDAELGVQAKIEIAFNYYDHVLENLYPDDYPSRQEDLREIPPTLQGTTLAEAISELSLDPPVSKGLGRSSDGRSLDLTLSTIHSAKGLEWGKVYLLSLVEGRFPGPYVSGRDNEEEERRLLYVALTRAKDELCLLTPRIDSWDEEGFSPCRFLSPIAEAEVEAFVDGRKSPLREVSALFSQYSEKDRAAPRASRAVAYRSTPDRPPRQGFYRPGSRPQAHYRPSAQSLSAPIQPQPDASPPIAKTPDYDPHYRPELGHRVNHPVFGPGLVIKKNGDIFTIDFERYGHKRVIATYARLTKIN